VVNHEDIHACTLSVRAAGTDGARVAGKRAGTRDLRCHDYLITGGRCRE
jgi:hypothetical protein